MEPSLAAALAQHPVAIIILKVIVSQDGCQGKIKTLAFTPHSHSSRSDSPLSATFSPGTIAFES
jgi:hypothetical protein